MLTLAHPADIVITARGMVSALGTDVVSACAAARAGITRPSELDYYSVRSPDDGEDEPVIGHVVPIVADGFEGTARLQRLAAAALADLCHDRTLPLHRPGILPTYLSLPNPIRHLHVRAADEQGSGEPTEPPAPLPAIDGDALLRTAFTTLALPSIPRVEFAASSGDTGVAEVLTRAIADFRAGRTTTALVGACDTLLDETTLAWLEESGRLKSPAVPAGLQPGEAAAFLLLEFRDGTSSRHAPALGKLDAVAVADDPSPFTAGKPPLGQGFAAALQEILPHMSDSSPGPWFIVDHTGEPRRAADWANALLRLLPSRPALQTHRTWYPAAAFGAVGAASGAVSLCLATSAFARRYAPAPTALIATATDGASRGIVALSAPPGGTV